MKFIKKLGVSLLYMTLPLFVILFLLTLLNYIGVINYKVLNITRFILLILSILIGGYKFGSNSNSKGWLEGLKLGLIITIIFIIINYLVMGITFNIKHIVYFGVILGSSILGSILGINIKTEKN